MKQYLLGSLLLFLLSSWNSANCFAADNEEAPLPLSTQTGGEIGAQVSHYRYQEHTVPDIEQSNQRGAKLGLTASVTGALEEYGIFATADLRYAFGNNDYKGQGTQSGVGTDLWDIRLLGGKDFIFHDHDNSELFSLSPYTGLGYRNLFDDQRGISSTGNAGYRRLTEYVYLPLGITTRLPVSKDARVGFNFEYDNLLLGNQESKLGDTPPNIFFEPNKPATTNNRFDNGFGLRGNIMYEEAHWSAGPFFDYWNVDGSEPSVSSQNSILPPFDFKVPHNQTIEYGLEVRYRF